MKTHIDMISENIARCKIGDDDNKFSVVLQDRKNIKTAAKMDCEISATMVGSELSFNRVDGQSLFVQKRVDFMLIDVMEQICEGKPQVETIKTVDGSRSVIKNLVEKLDRQSYQIDLYLHFEEDESIFGLGQDEQGIYNKRGHKQYLYQHNMISPMPFIISDKGYGILFDASCLIEFDDTKETTKVKFDTLDALEYYVIIGSPDEVIAGYRFLTGKAVMLPKWAFGYMQSKERYKTGEELLNIAKEYRKRGIPLDCVIQDWKTWQGDFWGEKIVDKQRYPDLNMLNEKIHALNVHTMVSVWPNMNSGGENHKAFFEAQKLLGDYSTYDAFDEKAREIYWKQAKKELFDGGFDAWWCDSTEPFTMSDWNGYPKRSEQQRYQLVGAEHKKYLDANVCNAYSLMHAKGIYENQRACDKSKRVVNLTRSGYAGIQKYGTILWAGDTSATWVTLKKEIAKGISVGLSGVPYWTVDAGAFFTGGVACWRKWANDEKADPVWFWNGDYDAGVNDERYRELYVRWLQFATFLPIFRSHGTDTPREIWNFGKEGTPFYDAIKKTIILRYELIEYIYSLAARVTHDDYTMMRSLLFDFSHDEIAKKIDDQYMFGDSILVCPVVQSISENERRVCYLPCGCSWVDYWSGEPYDGGQMVTQDVALNKIPLFVKKGSVIPKKKDIQYANQKTDEIEIHIYSGSDTSFRLYDDAGDSYDYEKGAYRWIDLIWDDKNSTLTIEGEMFSKTSQKFKVVCGEIEKLIEHTIGESRVEFR